MSRRIAAVAIIMILIASSINAASLSGRFLAGIRAGYSMADVIASPGYREETYLYPFHGFSVSIPLEYYFTDMIGIGTGAELVQKGYTYYHTYNGGFIADAGKGRLYLSFPLKAIISIGRDDLFVTFGAGGFLSFMLQKTERGRIMTTAYSQSGDNLVEAYSESSGAGEHDRIFDAGLLADITLSCSPADHLLLTASAAASFSLLSDEIRYQRKQTMRYNAALTITLGVMYMTGGASE